MRSITFAATAWFVLGMVASNVLAQTTYPTKPVRFVVPSAAGGGTEIVARILGSISPASARGS